MTGVFGGGVIFVVAALLWAAVLVPSWVRRREFKAAERNAVRLQRTLRVLAETAEVPTEVRIEATAREALAHEKLLRTAQRRQEAERQAKLAEARAAQVRAEMRAQQMRRKQVALARSARLRRPFVRRLRAITALVALLALAGALVGAGFVVAGQGYAVLGIAGLAFVAALGGLVLMAPGRVKVVEIPEEQIETAETVAAAPAEPSSLIAAEDASASVHAAAQAAAAARLERARGMARARAAERSDTAMENRPDSILLVQADQHRSAERADGTTLAEPVAEQGVPRPVHERPHRASSPGASSWNVSDPRREALRRAQQLATSERLRKMGVIDDPSEGMLDLDAVLRQRRSAS